MAAEKDEFMRLKIVSLRCVWFTSTSGFKVLRFKLNAAVAQVSLGERPIACLKRTLKIQYKPESIHSI